MFKNFAVPVPLENIDTFISNIPLEEERKELNEF